MKKNDKVYPLKIERLVLKGGRILDPQINLDKKADILISDGIIEKIGNIDVKGFAGEVVDCTGKIIVPGLIDIHVHLREPGREDKETIETGCMAAMAGGFTALCCMPNTEPPIDNRGSVEFIKKKAKALLVDVHPIGAITVGRKGVELTEMGDMIDAGAVAFSNDGSPVENSGVLRNAMEYLSMFDCPVIDHCEELSLSGDGVINEGIVSTMLGLKGIPSISEDIAVARDLYVAEYTGSAIHIAHVSTAKSVNMIREAKMRGVRVTAETCPHYLVLTEEAVKDYDTNAKMKPPLRTEMDRLALIEAVKDGTIDVIASDHAPHTIDDKDTEFDAAAFGIVGLETSLGLIITYLVKKNIISISDMVMRMAVAPRRLLNLKENRIEEKNRANLTMIDTEMRWSVDPKKFKSKSRNTPFSGWSLEGGCFGVYNNDQLYLQKS